MMKTSFKGLAEIASHEAIVTTRYKDSVGVWTIGIGHTSGAGAPNPVKINRQLSITEVMDIFARDIKKFEKRVNKAFTRDLTQAQFDAAVSFDFNTGGIHRASWVKAFNKGDDRTAQTSFMKWRKPREISSRVVRPNVTCFSKAAIKMMAAYRSIPQPAPAMSNGRAANA